MWASVFAEHIGFCVWSLRSALVLFMTPKAGFTISTADKFLPTSLVTLVGSLVRLGRAVRRDQGRDRLRHLRRRTCRAGGVARGDRSESQTSPRQAC
jgi:hypothetical protein